MLGSEVASGFPRREMGRVFLSIANALCVFFLKSNEMVNGKLRCCGWMEEPQVSSSAGVSCFTEPAFNVGIWGRGYAKSLFTFFHVLIFKHTAMVGFFACLWSLRVNKFRK
jgi:hypothetical protein